MFTCTDPAATLIRSLIGDADLPTGEGLRRVLNAGTTSLMTSLAAAPHAAAHASVPGDVCVLRTHGATTREGQQMLYAHLTGRTRVVLHPC
jgi:hypothetical protein